MIGKYRKRLSEIMPYSNLFYCFSSVPEGSEKAAAWKYNRGKRCLDKLSFVFLIVLVTGSYMLVGSRGRQNSFS